MRVHPLQIFAIVSVTLMPIVSEASPITAGSDLPEVTAADQSAEAESYPFAWSNSGLPSLFDDTGDPLLLISSHNDLGGFEHDKLRGWNGLFAWENGGGGGGACCGGPFGGGFPGFDASNFLSSDTNLNLDINLPLEERCEEGGGGTGQTVPEPSLLLLALPGLAFGVRRTVSRRQSSLTR